MQWASQCTILIAKNERLLKAVAESGCSILSLGIESLSQDGLDTVNKSWVRVSETADLLQKIQKMGIVPATEMIIGTDGDTPESVEATAEFIIKYKIPIPKFYILTPLPETDFYKEIKENGRLLHEDYTKYTTTDCVFIPQNFKPAELENAYMKLYKTVYSFPNIFKRIIFNRGLLKKTTVYLFSFFVNLIYRKFIKQGDAPNIL